MNINNVFPSKWLKSGDIPDNTDLVLTIKNVVVETVGQGEDSEDKPILYFTDSEKGMVLNKTNANTIANLYGPETDGWAGKRIGVYATEVQFGKQMTLALRVRMKAPNGASPKPAALTGTLLNKEQAIAAVVAAGLDKSALLSQLPVEADGHKYYRPERDSEKVYELVRQNTPPATEAEPF